jgi:hypothetical protein
MKWLFLKFSKHDLRGLRYLWLNPQYTHYVESRSIHIAESPSRILLNINKLGHTILNKYNNDAGLMDLTLVTAVDILSGHILF